MGSSKCGVRSAECGVKHSVQYGSGSDRLKKRFTHLTTQMALGGWKVRKATTVECDRSLRYRVTADRTPHFALRTSNSNFAQLNAVATAPVLYRVTVDRLRTSNFETFRHGFLAFIAGGPTPSITRNSIRLLALITSSPSWVRMASTSKLLLARLYGKSQSYSAVSPVSSTTGALRNIPSSSSTNFLIGCFLARRKPLSPLSELSLAWDGLRRDPFRNRALAQTLQLPSFPYGPLIRKSLPMPAEKPGKRVLPDPLAPRP